MTYLVHIYNSTTYNNVPVWELVGRKSNVADNDLPQAARALRAEHQVDSGKIELIDQNTMLTVKTLEFTLR